MKLTRRSALKTAAATAAGISIAPATSQAQMAKKKANPKYRIKNG
ncbi:MAG: twin-arginine translocation signal domain-containing protein, partial [Opitutae bacterium]|nr:twin-arginine translocation signal domain-containing protein [Opitutae bacterium]